MSSNWFLYFSTLSVNLVAMITGFDFAWTSPVLPKLNNPDHLQDNPFGRALTSFEEAWLTSIISVGATVGPFLGATIVDRIGRKKSILLLIVPLILSHFILAFSSNLYLFFLSRFLIGISCGCVYSIIPIYVGEIAEDHNRGNLGCFLTISASFGTVSAYLIGPYLTIRNFCLVLQIPALIFLLTFMVFVPESPYYLLMVKKEVEARQALRKFRSRYSEKEFLEIKSSTERESVKLSFSEIWENKAIRKGLFIGAGLMFFQQCSGITIFISYLQSIFVSSGSTLSPELSSIIVGSTQFLSTYFSSHLIEKLGRKVLLLCSLTGGFFSLTTIGVYFHLKNSGSDVSSISWLPVFCLISYIIMFMIGLGPVSWALIGEIFPTHFRNLASTIVTSFCLFLAFLLTFFFPNLKELIGMAYSFWLFAGSCLVGVVFVWKVVPETKGRSLTEIQEILQNQEMNF